MSNQMLEVESRILSSSANDIKGLTALIDHSEIWFWDNVFVQPSPVPRDATQPASRHPTERKAYNKVNLCQNSSAIQNSEENRGASEHKIGMHFSKETPRDAAEETGDDFSGALLNDHGPYKTAEIPHKKICDSGMVHDATESNDTKLCANNTENIIGDYNVEHLNYILPPKPVNPYFTALKAVGTGRRTHKKTLEELDMLSTKLAPGRNNASVYETPSSHGTKNKILSGNFDYLSKKEMPPVSKHQKSLEVTEKRTKNKESMTSGSRRPEDNKSSNTHSVAQRIRASKDKESLLVNKNEASNSSRLNGHCATQVSHGSSYGKEILRKKKHTQRDNYMWNEDNFHPLHTQSSALDKNFPSCVTHVEYDFPLHENTVTRINSAADTTPAFQLRETSFGKNNVPGHVSKEVNVIGTDISWCSEHYSLPGNSPYKITNLLEQSNPLNYSQILQNRHNYLQSFSHPKGLPESENDPPLMKTILSDPELWKKLMGQPILLQGLMLLPMALQEQLCEWGTGFLHDLMSKPDVLNRLLCLPEIFQHLAKQPDLFGVLLNSPVLLENLLNKSDIFEQLLYHPALLNSLVLNPYLLEQLFHQPEIFKGLVHQPEILHSLLQHPALINRLLTEPVILLSRLVLVWPVLQQILHHPEIWI